MQSSHDRSGREKGPLKGAKDGGGLQRPANGSTTAAGVRQKNSGCDEAGKPEDHRYNFSCEDPIFVCSFRKPAWRNDEVCEGEKCPYRGEEQEVHFTWVPDRYDIRGET